jgi:hypothetical protein
MVALYIKIIELYPVKTQFLPSVGIIKITLECWRKNLIESNMWMEK